MWKIDFWIPGMDQNEIWYFFDVLYMTSISSINHHFLAPSPLKPLKSRLGGQDLAGDLLIDHSDYQGPVSAQIYLPK